MRAGHNRKAGAGLFAALPLSLALAGCAGGPGSLEPGAAKPEINTIGSLFAFNAATPPPVTGLQAKPTDLDCPHVEVIEGTSAFRSTVGGQGNGAVRYQYSLGNVARECTVTGNQISIKVGVEGRVLIGPAGSPGAFSVPLRFVVRRESDKKPAASKLYRVAATVPAGDTQAGFSLVSDALVVPYTRVEADEDYTVLVGIDSAGGGGDKPVLKRRGR